MCKFSATRRRKGRGFDVTVCGRNVCPQLKARIEATVRTIALDLMGAKITNTLTIKVSVVNVGKINGSAALGCVVTDCTGSDNTQRAFPIAVDRSQSWAEMVDTIAHELQHVEQFRRGRLQQRRWATDGKVHVRWEGVELGPKESIPYRSRPWEAEAFATGARYKAGVRPLNFNERFAANPVIIRD